MKQQRNLLVKNQSLLEAKNEGQTKIKEIIRALEHLVPQKKKASSAFLHNDTVVATAVPQRVGQWNVAAFGRGGETDAWR